MNARALGACRSCGGDLRVVFCDLGSMPPANSFVRPDEAALVQPRYPLRAMVCSGCRLVQLDTVVDPRDIFSGYAYFSSASDSWLAHARTFCTAMSKRLGLGRHSLVIEVASNDGYLLRNFVQAGIPCLGVEPSANVAEAARASGVPTEVDFLGRESARNLLPRLGRHADLVVANNVLAHVPDVNDFVAGLALLAGPRGLLSIEAPHLLALVDGVQFDTIYHEHYSYWSLLAMERLFGRHGLVVVDVLRLPTHGGSLRVLVRSEGAVSGPAVAALRAEEIRRGLAGDAFYQGFDMRVREVLEEFRGWLSSAVAGGRRVAAYGAAAKGNTFLNAVGVTSGDILAVADRSPAKLGCLLPGSRIPVVTPLELLALAPDDILILPWNIAGEIRTALRSAGFAGRLLTAVPRMEER